MLAKNGIVAETAPNKHETLPRGDHAGSLALRADDRKGGAQVK
jgi:hypothetical protein